MTPQPSARKNGSFGYKAVVVFDDGRVKTPVRKNFPNRDAAIAYATRYIDANWNNSGERTPPVKDRSYY